MLKRRSIALSAAVLLIAAVISVGCGADASEGQMPTLNVGDNWEYDSFSEGSYYTMALEVTGEGYANGQPCWIFEMSFTPGFMGVTYASARLDKSNLARLQYQASGTMMGIPFSIAETCSYEPADASMFPLEVGKELTRTLTLTQTLTMGVETETDTTTETLVRKVEAIEEVTVPAGTFKCFKITDEDSTLWYSDEVKYWVKTVDNDGSTLELKSYSV